MGTTKSRSGAARKAPQSRAQFRIAEILFINFKR
jgi:hypothetical protein